MNAPRHRRCRGQSLVETTVSAGVVMVLAGGLFSMLSDSGAMFGESVRVEQQRREVDAALALLSRDLEQAAADSLVIDGSQPDGDTVRLTLPLDLAASPPTFGAIVTTDGRAVAHLGAQVEWSTRATEGRPSRTLVRRVVAADQRTLLEEQVLCNDLDLVRTDGTKSFVVARPANGRTVELTLRRLSFVGADERGDDGSSSNGTATRCHVQSASVRILSR
ncbi:MAG: hypothetical protein JNL90_01715 [Planctomycetes bacterium]|nr:hypothetical protein [Planctomycetota bacterium]